MLNEDIVSKTWREKSGKLESEDFHEKILDEKRVTVGTQQRSVPHRKLCCRKRVEWTNCLRCRGENFRRSEKRRRQAAADPIHSGGAKKILAARSLGQEGDRKFLFRWR